MDILWLDETACQDAAQVGGKAANLSKLAAAHRVPPGFCVTAKAYTRWGGDWVPAALYEGVAVAYAMLGKRCGVEAPSVAVRSSAVDEDGGAASFAGQHETYLNVIGALPVADAVARCWASARSERALEYRRQQGLSGDGRPAVLVQQLVPADVAAVVFSANPVTGARDEVLINASWGLGESIVGGTVTPDAWTLRRGDLSVASRQIGEKRRMTVRAPDGTREVEVPRLMRAQPAIHEGQAAEMARLALALENEMGWPVDIECAWNAGQLYLLQCRPITTLKET
jgi:pyruvate,water dikinase